MHGTRPLAEDTAVHYTIDTQKRRSPSGISAARCHFSPGEAFKDARVNVSIRTDSLEVIDDISEKDRQEIHHRMYDEVLEADRFPEIVYECSGVTGSGNGDRYWVVLNGELTLHGVTRGLPVSARLVTNGDSLRASGEFTVRQSDYGITPISAVGGTIRVKDKVKCTFDIVAPKRD